jgi:hypothetical protein
MSAMHTRPFFDPFARLAIAFALTALAGCGDAEPTDAGFDTPVEEKGLDATRDHHWIYDGMLPHLSDWRLTVSLAGHTVRVTGVLPADWSRPLPDYVVPRPQPDGRTEIHVVYPISTAQLVDPQSGEPTGNRNPDPGRYPILAAWSYTATNVGGQGVPWGGFPYLQFDHERAIAFHGPITATEGEWALLRGPVSHACARMQGEHVVEMAHLIGLDVSRPEELEATYQAGGTGPDGEPDFLVEVIDDFDRFEGRIVDVAYPGYGPFERPRGDEVQVFRTWSSDDHPRFVCPANLQPLPPAAQADPAADVPEDTSADAPPQEVFIPTCAHMPAADRLPIAVESLGEIACPAGYELSWVGDHGGRVCANADTVLGPFTQAMRERCDKWGGGTACQKDVWSLSLALSARGDGLCPIGAALDYKHTLYCVEGDDAFGPFPEALIAICESAGGGNACRSARWRTSLLEDALLRLRTVPPAP